MVPTQRTTEARETRRDGEHGPIPCRARVRTLVGKALISYSIREVIVMKRPASEPDIEQPEPDENKEPVVKKEPDNKQPAENKEADNKQPAQEAAIQEPDNKQQEPDNKEPELSEASGNGSKTTLFYSSGAAGNSKPLRSIE